MFGLIKKHVDEEWILSLIQQIIYNDPVQNVYKKSSARKFRLIPHYKSLFNADKQHGLPIGNLTSQFFSNVYLDVMDQYIKRELKCRYYLRYVDDFVIIGEDTWFLNECFRRIREYIARELNITLHPRKKLINKVENGIDFVGFFVLPHRVFLRKQTIYKIVCCIKEWKKKYNPYQNQILEKFFRSINSYLGMLVNLNSFNLRFIFTTKLNSLFICSDILFSKCCIKVY